MQPQQSLVEYRDITTIEGETITLDSEDVVVGLQGFGVRPLRAKTDGKKLTVEFIRSEALPYFQKIQASLAGALAEPLLVDYNQILLARVAWKGLLTMMRNVSIQR
jgi:hypothetical protein